MKCTAKLTSKILPQESYEQSETTQFESSKTKDLQSVRRL